LDESGSQTLPAILPDHIEETIRSVRRLHVEHHNKSTGLQRTIGRITGAIGRPMFVGLLAVGIVTWMSVNLVGRDLGYPMLDAPPFPWLQGAMTAMSLFMVAFIVGTQRHEDQLAEQREMITLELALLSEQKIAKLIQLLEEFRHDSPELRDRVDEEAEVMAKPADAHSVFNAIQETHSAVSGNAGRTPR
jgi:uncharacterized membrane protein